MAAQTTLPAAIVSNKGMIDKVVGSLIGLTSTGLGNNTIRDTNIRKFQELGYDSKRLTNRVLSQLVGANSIDLGSDDSTVQSVVQSVWEAIFDIALV